MSLEICETITPDKLQLKNSRFFKDRVQLTIEPDAQCKFTKINDELYYRQQKVYFPLFENIIFLKISKDNQPKNLPLLFKGNFIEENEIGMIKAVIRENNEKESLKYEEYKKILDKDISFIIENMNTEITNQKNFLKKDYLTKHQYNENINTLVRAYADILSIKLGNDMNLRSEDRSLINKFYSNMIEGLRNNNINKYILIDIKDSEIKDIVIKESVQRKSTDEAINKKDTEEETELK